jgi:hypothetical protein
MKNSQFSLRSPGAIADLDVALSSFLLFRLENRWNPQLILLSTCPTINRRVSIVSYASKTSIVGGCIRRENIEKTGKPRFLVLVAIIDIAKAREA